MRETQKEQWTASGIYRKETGEKKKKQREPRKEMKYRQRGSYEEIGDNDKGF